MPWNLKAGSVITDYIRQGVYENMQIGHLTSEDGVVVVVEINQGDAVYIRTHPTSGVQFKYVPILIHRMENVLNCHP